MALAFKHTIAPVTVDPDPNMTEPEPSRVFRTELRDGQASGGDFTLLALLLDGTSASFAVWYKLTETKTWMLAHGAAITYPLEVCSLGGLEGDVDVFIQVTAAVGGPTQVGFAVV